MTMTSYPPPHVESFASAFRRRRRAFKKAHDEQQRELPSRIQRVHHDCPLLAHFLPKGYSCYNQLCPGSRLLDSTLRTRGCLTEVAGAAGVGKSQLLMQIAVNFITRQQQPDTRQDIVLVLTASTGWGPRCAQILKLKQPNNARDAARRIKVVEVFSLKEARAVLENVLTEQLENEKRGQKREREFSDNAGGGLVVPSHEGPVPVRPSLGLIIFDGFSVLLAAEQQALSRKDSAEQGDAGDSRKNPPPVLAAREKFLFELVRILRVLPVPTFFTSHLSQQNFGGPQTEALGVALGRIWTLHAPHRRLFLTKTGIGRFRAVFLDEKAAAQRTANLVFVKGLLEIEED
ncbi:unnamed protein product [Amoebophrya sp. A25]|nr:unnamed protein product [Amoebophrya sp. A25]|eukprot:GSA25T00026186001.1